MNCCCASKCIRVLRIPYVNCFEVSQAHFNLCLRILFPQHTPAGVVPSDVVQLWAVFRGDKHNIIPRFFSRSRKLAIARREMAIAQRMRRLHDPSWTPHQTM